MALDEQVSTGLGFQYAEIDWKENHPFNTQFEDGYYWLKPQRECFEDTIQSGNDVYVNISGLAETNYVFLEGNDLACRFSQLKENERFCIAETGFGTGLNFFATCDLWQKSTISNQSLHYYSIEKYPLSPEDFGRMAEYYRTTWPQLSISIEAVLTNYYNLAPGIQTITFSINQSVVFLHLIIDDVCSALKNFQFNADAWFLDGFSPSKNPSMWSKQLFHLISQHTNQGGTLATYTAAGAIRRELQVSGFVVNKRKGFGDKRECITAFIQDEHFLAESNKAQELAHRKPWLSKAIDSSKGSKSVSKDIQKSILVIGAGLSGSLCANELAIKGFRVDVWDNRFETHNAQSNDKKNNNSNAHISNQKTNVVDNGVGNCPKYAIAYVRFYPNKTALSEWSLQSYTAFIRQINGYKHINNFGDVWQGCGLVQLYDRDDGKARRRLLHDSGTLTSIAQFDNIPMVESDFLKEYGYDALYYHEAGSINAKEYCKLKLNHDNIHCHGKKAIRIAKTHDAQADESVWVVRDDESKEYHYHNVIIANGADCYSLLKKVAVDETMVFEKLSTKEEDAFWPVKQVKGQESVVRFKQPHGVSKIICGSHYLIPIDRHTLAIGAGFHRDSLDNVIEQRLHEMNINAAKKDYAFLNLAWDDAEVISGFAGIRCYSPDYIPLVGELFDVKKYIDLMAKPLAKDRNYRFDESFTHAYQKEIRLQGLYICHGMGARGITSSFLSAKILASQISGEPMAISENLWEAVYPIRFLNRALIKNGIRSGI